MMNNVAGMSRLTWWLATSAVVVTVLAVYWPALSAGYVWDDILTFQQRGWLYYGDEWKSYIFTGFNEWDKYFRPLVVALFVLQVRTFGGDPAGMHAVTLAMHLVNVFLVILFARNIAPKEWELSGKVALLAGLIYGIHPMLVETVVWIGCQFDQMQIMTMLLGLFAASLIKNRWIRMVVVSLCFLLSALSKESAAAFPALVFLFDWLFRTNDRLSLWQRLATLLKEGWPTYVGLVLIGAGYLILRYQMMGSTVPGITSEMLIPDVVRIETVAYVYLKYWMVVFGVPTDLNPLHAVGSVEFGESVALLFLRIAAGLGILALGGLAVSRSFKTTGVLVMAVTLYLFPVIGFIPIQFDESIYHERYAIGAVVLTTVLMPMIFFEWREAFSRHVPVVMRLLPVVAMVWLTWAVVNIRVTIPLWADNLALWEWAAKGNPGSASANANLIGAYMMYGEFDSARDALQEVVSNGIDCPVCYINGFIMAINGEGDVELAESMVDRLRRSPDIMDDKSVRFLYLRTAAHYELRLGNYEDAVDLLEAAIDLEGYDSHSYMLLAEAMVAQGRQEAASDAAEKSLAMVNPMNAEKSRKIADRILQGEVVYAGKIK